MAELLSGIEQLAPVEALKASFWVYPLVNAAHIAAIGTLFACVMLMDFAALGVHRRLASAGAVQLLRPVALSAFGVAVATGLLLFSVRATEYAVNPAFRLKLLLIVLAGLNFLLFTRTDPPPRTTATVSLVLWCCVLLAGRFIGFL
ncbi:MAG: hypothetical protein K5872_13795 [Rhizobiaceae bacterium]|nr:hypothetical protein [Rhizobiaceae bacterium]MCV0407293.1 hypothetical protein [Rhizobiaceae bacterium]